MKLWMRCIQLLETADKALRLLRIAVGIGLVLTVCGSIRSRR